MSGSFVLCNEYTPADKANKTCTSTDKQPSKTVEASMEGNRIVRLSLSSLPTFAGEEAKDDEDASEFKS